MKITSKSTAKIVRLLTPPTATTLLDDAPPRGLTVRRLMNQRRYAKLRSKYTIVRIAGNHLLCVANLRDRGCDYI